jgi:hypothetical protein
MDDPYGNPNPKWVLDDTVSASNRLPVCETHFGLQQRHTGDSYAERVLFWVMLLEKTKNEY